MMEQEVKQAERELQSFIYNCNKLVRLYERIVEIDQDLSTYGLYSPSFKPPEEAFFQKGTKVYSVEPLLVKFDEQDAYIKKYKEINRQVQRMVRVLQTLNDEEIELLYYRIERGYTYTMLGTKYYLSTHAIFNKFTKLYRKIEELL